MKPEVMLWAGIMTGPIVWFINLESAFALAPLACSAKSKAFLYVVSGVSLVLIALAGALSFSQWKVPERSPSGGIVPVQPRRRGMAFAGIGISGLSFLVICAQAIPNLLLAGCE